MTGDGRVTLRVVCSEPYHSKVTAIAEFVGALAQDVVVWIPRPPIVRLGQISAFSEPSIGLFFPAGEGELEGGLPAGTERLRVQVECACGYRLERRWESIEPIITRLILGGVSQIDIRRLDRLSLAASG